MVFFKVLLQVQFCLHFDQSWKKWRNFAFFPIPPPYHLRLLKGFPFSNIELEKKTQKIETEFRSSKQKRAAIMAKLYPHFRSTFIGPGIFPCVFFFCRFVFSCNPFLLFGYLARRRSTNGKTGTPRNPHKPHTPTLLPPGKISKVT